MQNHRHYDLVYRAFYNMSFSPEKRAHWYCKELDIDLEKLREAGADDRALKKYENLWVKWMQAQGRCLSPMITGPANFPVARNQKALDAEHKACAACIEYFDRVMAALQKAANPELRPIMSGDPDALDRLKEKLASLKKAQETMKAANALLRKKPIDKARLAEILGSEERAEKALEPDFLGSIGFPRYALANNRAEIKRIEGRIKQIEARKESSQKDVRLSGVRVHENTDIMRLQIFFEDKPDREMIALLKKNAFKWAPSQGAWQRQLTNNAVYAFKSQILPAL